MFVKYMHLERYGNEELWNIIKKHKNPKIDFAYLQRLTITKVKEMRKDIFNG